MDAVNPPSPAATLGDDDANQLRLLSIFHYVVAAITGLFSLFPALHLLMGLAMVTGKLPMASSNPGAEELEPQLVGWVKAAFA